MSRTCWATFPIFEVRADGSCACGSAACKKVGKHPEYPFGSLGIGEQVRGREGRAYGVATGHRSGVFVLDLDSEDAVSWAEAKGLPETHTVATGKGLHLYFGLPPGASVKNSAGQLAKGVDIRGEGGFVVAAGSVHKSGAVYETIDDRDPVDAPAWLLEWPGLYGAVAKNAVAADNAPLPVEGLELERRTRMSIEYLATAPVSVEGSQGSSALWDVAIHLVRRLELPLDLAASLIESEWNGRCGPPWSEREIAHKLEDARDKSDMPTGTAPEGFGVIRVPAPEARTGYTHVPGHNAALSDCKKTAFSNVIEALCTHPDWDGVLRYDVFRRRAVAIKPPLRLSLETSGLSNVDVSGVRSWFEAHGVIVGVDDCARAIECACQRTEFHPVKDYLAGLKPCDPSIIAGLATLGLGSKDPLAPELLRKFLVSAVRRILRPGCQVDTMPVLVGKQGARKTSFVRELFGHDLARTQMPDLASKDASVALAGFWGIELAELDRVLKAETSTVKEFLTRTYDDYRPPYGRTDLRFPRECVFVGTVNEWEFLRDPTGSRRFWPISVDMSDTDWVAAHRDEVWGAAVALEATGEPHWFADENALEAMRQPFVETDAWHERIAAYCKGKDWVSSADVYINVGGKLEMMDQNVKRRVGGTLRRLGCEPHVRTLDGKCLRGWSVPRDYGDHERNE